MHYNYTNNVLQFCDGADWTDMGDSSPSAAGTACTSPASPEGSLEYNETNNAYQFCNGDTWKTVSGQSYAAAGSSGCLAPSFGEKTIEYNTSSNKMQFCNGDTWINTTKSTIASTIPFTENLVLWLDSEDIDGDGAIEGVSETGITAGKVTLWVDKSSQGNNAISEGDDPTFAESVDGRNMIEFNLNRLIIGQPASLAYTPQSTSMTIFIAVNNDNGTQGAYISKAGSTGNLRGPYIFGQSNQVDVFSGGVQHPDLDNYNIGNEYYSYILEANSSGAYFYTGGIVNLTAGSIGTGSNTSDWILGARRTSDTNTGAGFEMDGGHIGEVIIFDLALSDASRTTIEDYLASKW
tara:strand:+ start:236438 stop:237487 length:1050 start_codon:yes stop_codon:yes gene_type:complete